MERDVRYITVAIAVMALLAGLAGFLLWQWENAAGDGGAAYLIEVEGGVDGLESGSAVRYLGVRVGRVADVRLAEDDIGKVEVAITVTPQTPVNTSTVASVQPEGITGRSYISLATSRQDAPRAPESGERLRIPSEPSNLDRALASAPALLERLTDVAEGLEELVGPQNRTATRELLERTTKLTETLTARVGTLGDRAEETLDRVDAAASEAEATLRATREPLPQLERTLREIGSASARLDRMLADAEPAVAQVRGHTLDELDALLGELRSATREFDHLARQLRRNPSQVLYGAPRDGVEIPP